MGNPCIFCKIIRGEIPSHKIYEDENYFAFLDIHPISPGHTLVVPKRHSIDLLHAPIEDRRGLLDVVVKIVPAILKVVHAHAFNVGINTGKDSGQIVFHTHVHIIPRKLKDGLSDWRNTPQTSEELSQIAHKIRRQL